MLPKQKEGEKYPAFVLPLIYQSLASTSHWLKQTRNQFGKGVWKMYCRGQ